MLDVCFVDGVDGVWVVVDVVGVIVGFYEGVVFIGGDVWVVKDL